MWRTVPLLALLVLGCSEPRRGRGGGSRDALSTDVRLEEDVGSAADGGRDAAADGGDEDAARDEDAGARGGVPGIVRCGTGGLECDVSNDSDIPGVESTKCCSPNELDGPYSCETESVTCGQNVFCDGPEDCTNGPCCTYYAQPGEFYAACWPTQETNCIRACHGDQDCLSGQVCCPLFGRGALRWCANGPTCP